MVHFGLISWLPIYLLETKGFNKEQMGIAFWLFEWAAIPSTLLAGYISDKIFKGYRMPPAIGAYELCSRRFTWNKSYRLGCGLLW
ncbi:MFS transporter [Campylobacter coli]|nr:MFS transporter [Campylobacter coli]